MDDQRDNQPSPAPEPEVEIIVPAYVYDYVTRDFTPRIILDKEALDFMKVRRKGHSR